MVKDDSINSLRALRAQIRMELDKLSYMALRLAEMQEIVTEILEEEHNAHSEPRECGEN